jgi:hypothetical protein
MKAIVERFEGEVAVLEIDGERFENVALDTLPEGTCEGDMLIGRPGEWRRDPEGTAERLKRNADLMGRLFRKRE